MALSFQQLLVAIPLVLKGGNVPSIVGEAGIGKSALVTAVAEKMKAKLMTTVVSLSEKGDLAIPVPPLTETSFLDTKNYGRLADVQFGYTHTLIQIIQAAEQQPNQPIIWFLDEFNRGSQAVQSELMNLVLQRRIHDIVLPRQVHIVLAENPDDDMAGFEKTDYAVERGDAAIKDRTTRLVMAVSVSDWLSWASSGAPRAHIHPLVQKFITQYAELLYPTTRHEDLNPTPRAWHRVSDNLYELVQLPKEQADVLMFDIFSGDLGANVARQFVQFIVQQLPTLTAQDIFESKPYGPKVPHVIDEKFKNMDELQKLTVMKSVLLTGQLTIENNAARLSRLLQLMSPDSQYALVKQLTDSPVLDQLFASDGHYANVLYQQIMDVATR
ncbi:ATP-binding protein [Leuconostoc fallax]|uniref:ATP-binding protein n=1 Tax=Leuconostoc fallax TaxID=1251 RepID=UPI002091A625|nr:ATP-binding protein [Leuconostoc fallax]